MNIGFFFTYGYSLKTWKNSGNISRELQILELLTERYDITFTLFTYGDEDDFKIIEKNKKFKIVPIYSKIKPSNIKIINYLKSFLILYKFKKEIKNTNIIHQHQLLGSWVTIFIKFIFKKPLLIRTGYDMYLFSKFENKNRFLVVLYKLLTLISLKFCDLYTVTSKSDKNFLGKKFKKYSYKILLRPNFVDNNFQTLIETRSSKKILSVGRLTYQKNFELLINQFKNSDFEIDIVGDGELLKPLKSLAKTNNVKVNFLGNVEFSTLLKLYNKYFFYVSTSLYEGNPKSVLEALASGCIVLASNIPNHQEIIENEENGYLFDLENPNIVELCKKITEDKDLINKISSNATKYLEENNSIDLLAQDMSLDYATLIKS